MDIRQSVAWAELSRTPPRSPRIEHTAKEVIQASQVPEDWFSSPRFLLFDLPLHFAPVPDGAAVSNETLAGLYAASVEPIVVDLNTRRTGQSGVSGFFPPVVVLEGQNRVRAARLRGSETIRAWVGSLAAARLGLIHADHQLSSSELQKKLQSALDQRLGVDPSGGGLGPPRPYIREVYPLENYFVYDYDDKSYKCKYKVDLPSRGVQLKGAPAEVKQKYVPLKAARAPVAMRIHEAAVLSGGAPSSLGEGSGPPYDSGLGIQPEANRMRSKALFPGAKRGVKAFAGTEMTDLAYERHRGAAQSDTRKKFEEGKSKPRPAGLHGTAGYVGYPGASRKQQEKTKGATGSDMSRVLSGDYIKKIVTDYTAACKAGYKPRLEAKTPPGGEDMVRGLKKADVDSPYAVAWWHYKKYGGFGEGKK